MAVSITGTAGALRPVTVNLTGLAASTAHVVSVATPMGHTVTSRVTADGSGNASFAFVPQSAGSYAVSAVAAVPAVVTSGSFWAGGHGT